MAKPAPIQFNLPAVAAGAPVAAQAGPESLLDPIDLGLFQTVKQALGAEFTAFSAADDIQISRLTLRLIWDAKQELKLTLSSSAAKSYDFLTLEEKQQAILKHLSDKQIKKLPKQTVQTFCVAVETEHCKQPLQESDPQFLAFALRQLGADFDTGSEGFKVYHYLTSFHEYATTVGQFQQACEELREATQAVANLPHVQQIEAWYEAKIAMEAAKIQLDSATGDTSAALINAFEAAKFAEQRAQATVKVRDPSFDPDATSVVMQRLKDARQDMISIASKIKPLQSSVAQKYLGLNQTSQHTVSAIIRLAAYKVAYDKLDQFVRSICFRENIRNASFFAPNLPIPASVPAAAAAAPPLAAVAPALQAMPALPAPISDFQNQLEQLGTKQEEFETAVRANYLATAAKIGQLAEAQVASAGPGSGQTVLGELLGFVDAARAAAPAPALLLNIGQVLQQAQNNSPLQLSRASLFQVNSVSVRGVQLVADDMMVNRKLLEQAYRRAEAKLPSKARKDEFSAKTFVTHTVSDQVAILRHMFTEQLYPGYDFKDLDAAQAAQVDVYANAARQSLVLSAQTLTVSDSPAALAHAFYLARPEIRVAIYTQASPIVGPPQPETIGAYLGFHHFMKQEERVSPDVTLVKSVNNFYAEVGGYAGLPSKHECEAAFTTMWETLAAHNPELKGKALSRATLMELAKVPVDKLADYGAMKPAPAPAPPVAGVAAAPVPDPVADQDKRNKAIANHLFSPENKHRMLAPEKQQDLLKKLGLTARIKETQLAAEGSKPARLKSSAEREGKEKPWDEIRRDLIAAFEERLNLLSPSAKPLAQNLVDAYFNALTLSEREIVKGAVRRENDGIVSTLTKDEIVTAMVQNLCAAPLSEASIQQYLADLEQEGQKSRQEKARYDEPPHPKGQETPKTYAALAGTGLIANLKGQEPEGLTIGAPKKGVVTAQAFSVTDNNGHRATLILNQAGADGLLFALKSKKFPVEKVRLLVQMVLHNAQVNQKTFEFTGKAAFDKSTFKKFAIELLKQRPGAIVTCNGHKEKKITAEKQQQWFKEAQDELAKERDALLESDENHRKALQFQHGVERHREPGAAGAIDLDPRFFPPPPAPAPAPLGQPPAALAPLPVVAGVLQAAPAPAPEGGPDPAPVEGFNFIEPAFGAYQGPNSWSPQRRPLVPRSPVQPGPGPLGGGRLMPNFRLEDPVARAYDMPRASSLGEESHYAELQPVHAQVGDQRAAPSPLLSAAAAPEDDGEYEEISGPDDEPEALSNPSYNLIDGLSPGDRGAGYDEGDDGSIHNGAGPDASSAQGASFYGDLLGAAEGPGQDSWSPPDDPDSASFREPEALEAPAPEDKQKRSWRSGSSKSAPSRAAEPAVGHQLLPIGASRCLSPGADHGLGQEESSL